MICIANKGKYSPECILHMVIGWKYYMEFITNNRKYSLECVLHMMNHAVFFFFFFFFFLFFFKLLVHWEEVQYEIDAICKHGTIPFFWENLFEMILVVTMRTRSIQLWL